MGQVYIPWEIAENKLHFKFNPQNGRNKQNSVLDDCLPFWEATSFFQFLKHPSYTKEISLGLYNTFAWTMFSPYTWDPYGLQMKLIPFLNSAFNASWQFKWHKQILEKYHASDKTSLSWKDYLKAIHAALSMDYIRARNEFSPIYLPDLAFAYSFDFGKICLGLINEAYNDFLSIAIKIEEIDAFLEASQLMEIPDSCVPSAKVDSVLKNVYEILFGSIHNYKRDLLLLMRG